MVEPTPFVVKPKTLAKRYKMRDYKITFVPGAPADKRWHWEVTEVVTSKYSGDASTMQTAQKAAEKHIDKIISIRGK